MKGPGVCPEVGPRCDGSGDGFGDIATFEKVDGFGKSKIEKNKKDTKHQKRAEMEVGNFSFFSQSLLKCLNLKWCSTTQDKKTSRLVTAVTGQKNGFEKRLRSRFRKHAED